MGVGAAPQISNLGGCQLKGIDYARVHIQHPFADNPQGQKLGVRVARLTANGNTSCGKKINKCENSRLNRPSLLNAHNFEIEALESSDFSMYPIFDEQTFDSKSCQRSAPYRSDTLKIRGSQAFQVQFQKSAGLWRKTIGTQHNP